MTYELKIEPIQRYELFMSGFTLQLWIIFLNLLPWIAWSQDCINVVRRSDIESESDMEEFHNCLNKHRSGMFAGCSFLLLGFPIIVAHVHYRHRMAVTLGAFLNLNLTRWFYSASWLIAAVMLCTVIPALGIFVAYYDWELPGEYQSFGYAMQFQLFHLFNILLDSVLVPLGFAASMPWLIQLLFACGWFQSHHYVLTMENRMAMQPKGCPKWALLTIFGTIASITLIGALADAFDYAKDGFFSYDGGSQFLGIVMFISWELQSFMDMLASFGLEERIQFLNKHVQGMEEYIGNGHR